MQLSIVTTLYFSAPHLEAFHERMSRAAAELTDDYEIIYVNDGSPDESLGIAVRLFESDAHVKVIDLSRNFGHHKAIMTGLSAAQGERVFLIDCDLEEEPELLSTFVDAARNCGADVAYGIQCTRKGGTFERISGALFYKVFNLLSYHKIPENILTVRLMSRRYVESLLLYREREFVISGLWTATGFAQVPVSVVKGSRRATTYNIRRKIASFVDAVTSFSDRPLVFIFYLGLVIVSLSSLAAGWLIARRLFFGVLLAGWPSLIVSIWLLGGLTIFCIGLVGIYLSKVYLETKQRPTSIIRHTYDHSAEVNCARCNPSESGRLLHAEDTGSRFHPVGS
jgi:putative glycosyltransferase